MVFKSNVHARLLDLPPVAEFTKPNVSSIRTADVGRFLQVQGTVIRTGMVCILTKWGIFFRTFQTQVKMLEAERVYQCTRCSSIESVEADIAKVSF